ncbi:2537_t:CDS:1 [Cetraspora pellucida]|uniref:2537_t:CDS:1 n=1 Tax=Cetraspora pellucida TaxID=1433469 RepID=A0A9N9NIR7_9GLOM|nr:2537_t:CDS:1 [Cetraspora pellucida]
MVANVLVATRINKGSEEVQPKMCDSWYIDVYRERYVQEIIFPDNYPLQQLREKLKEIQQILEEQNLWLVEGINLVYNQCAKRSDEKNKNYFEELNCCAQKIISLQLDFCEQQSILEEVIVKKGHIFEQFIVNITLLNDVVISPNWNLEHYVVIIIMTY